MSILRAVLVGVACAAMAACASDPAPVTHGKPFPGQLPPPPPVAPQDPLPVEAPPQGAFQPNANVFLCHDSVRNAPPTVAGRMAAPGPIMELRGIVMARMPVNDSCLMSGFGPRFGRAHKGADYIPFPEPNGRGLPRTVYSAAPGIVVQAQEGRGWGYYVLVDHGGVLTRYAHLASFAPGIAVGQAIGFGKPLGTMGRSGNATGIHLHFEVLLGQWRSAADARFLTAVDPMAVPDWVPPGQS